MNADLVIPIDRYIADNRKALADLQWNDPDDASIPQIEGCIAHALRMLEAGESHYVLF